MSTTASRNSAVGTTPALAMSITRSRARSKSSSLHKALTRISKVAVFGLISLSGILP
uniref:Uncharacterized protein n=1 Tax=Arundo donax TaxID=35708 RepID=A0A0A9F0G0_ARUDO